MERSARGIWQRRRRRRLTEEDAAPADRVPSSLLAAAEDGPPRGATLRLAVGGTKVIAVVGGEGGDPYEWWGAIHWLAAPSGAGREAD